MDNITIYPFKFKHLKDLIEMHESNNYAQVAILEMKTLPKIGFIAYLNDKTPIAAGFLRRLEPCFAQIDTLVSNKYMGSIVRHRGISVVVESLITEAQVLKLQGLICFTDSADILKRSEDLGFSQVNQKIIAKSLK